MSRSRRKHNIRGNTSAESEKEDKKLWHKAFRRKTKIITTGKKNLDDIVFPSVKDISDTWTMAKDGKFKFETTDEDAKKWLRK